MTGVSCMVPWGVLYGTMGCPVWYPRLGCAVWVSCVPTRALPESASSCATIADIDNQVSDYRIGRSTILGGCYFANFVF